MAISSRIRRPWRLAAFLVVLLAAWGGHARSQAEEGGGARSSLTDLMERLVDLNERKRGAITEAERTGNWIPVELLDAEVERFRLEVLPEGRRFEGWIGAVTETSLDTVTLDLCSPHPHICTPRFAARLKATLTLPLVSRSGRRAPIPLELLGRLWKGQLVRVDVTLVASPTLLLTGDWPVGLMLSGIPHDLQLVGPALSDPALPRAQEALEALFAAIRSVGVALVPAPPEPSGVEQRLRGGKEPDAASKRALWEPYWVESLARELGPANPREEGLIRPVALHAPPLEAVDRDSNRLTVLLGLYALAARFPVDWGDTGPALGVALRGERWTGEVAALDRKDLLRKVMLLAERIRTLRPGAVDHEALGLPDLQPDALKRWHEWLARLANPDRAGDASLRLLDAEFQRESASSEGTTILHGEVLVSARPMSRVALAIRWNRPGQPASPETVLRISSREFLVRIPIPEPGAWEIRARVLAPPSPEGRAESMTVELKEAPPSSWKHAVPEVGPPTRHAPVDLAGDWNGVLWWLGRDGAVQVRALSMTLTARDGYAGGTGTLVESRASGSAKVSIGPMLSTHRTDPRLLDLSLGMRTSFEMRTFAEGTLMLGTSVGAGEQQHLWLESPGARPATAVWERRTEPAVYPGAYAMEPVDLARLLPEKVRGGRTPEEFARQGGLAGTLRIDKDGTWSWAASWPGGSEQASGTWEGADDRMTLRYPPRNPRDRFEIPRANECSLDGDILHWRISHVRTVVLKRIR